MKSTTIKQTRPRSTRNNGSGIVYEVRESCGETRESFTPRLGLHVSIRSIQDWEQNGTFPQRDKWARRQLLECALGIPSEERSQLIQEWIESEQVFWESLKR